MKKQSRTVPRRRQSVSPTPRRHCQVDEKLVDRPPRYWAPARRESAMLGITNGCQPQLDNTRARSVSCGAGI